MKLHLVGPSYDTNIPNFEQQRTINWYPVGDEPTMTAPRYNYILMPTPGITQLFDFGDFNSGRASIVYRDVAYVVLDDTFALIEEDGTPSYIDLLATTTGAVSICGAMNGILLADGTSAYFYDTVTNTFTTITDGDLPANPTACTYYDGFNILSFADSEKIYYGTDPLSWDATHFNSANSSADYLTMCMADHEELWLFGTDTTEVWYNTGDGELPLARRPGVLLTTGCIAPNTVCVSNSNFYWLGKDRQGGYQVYTAPSYTYNANLLPNQAGIASKISSYETVSDAYAFMHRIGQHSFYVLTFPTENATWVYDVYNQQWHQRSSITTQDPFSVNYEPYMKAHRAKNYFYAYGIHFVLDQYTGAIAKYDEDVYTEFDMPLIRKRRTSQLAADIVQVAERAIYNNELSTYHNLVLNMLPSVGDQIECPDPQVEVRLSSDGGFTWDTCGTRSFGIAGEYDTQVKWDILGQHRNLVFEIIVADPVKAVFLGATVDMTRDSQ